MHKILNYQGSKAKLLPTIEKTINENLKPGKAFLDIFAGGCSVANAFWGKTVVYANDLEPFSYAIASSFIDAWKYQSMTNEELNFFKKNYNYNKQILSKTYEEQVEREKKYLIGNQENDLISLYKELPTIWNGVYSVFLNSNPHPDILRKQNVDCLFTFYYAGTYFGLNQSIQIDSLHYAIARTSELTNKNLLFSYLFHLMNLCSFSKDGHMAQPLNPENNPKRLLRVRKLNIENLFFNELTTKGSNFLPLDSSDNIIKASKAFNYDITDLQNTTNILDDVGCVYADPPYTDMQYSRYYHLLNTLYEYNYPLPTIKKGKATTGLYLENRKQSKLSQHSNCFNIMSDLIIECKKKNINIIISFAYPKDATTQKTDRYVMDINQLIEFCKSIYDLSNVSVLSLDYKHSNHRNHEQKRVLEYLIICRGKDEK